MSPGMAGNSSKHAVLSGLNSSGSGKRIHSPSLMSDLECNSLPGLVVALRGLCSEFNYST